MCVFCFSFLLVFHCAADAVIYVQNNFVTSHAIKFIFMCCKWTCPLSTFSSYNKWLDSFNFNWLVWFVNNSTRFCVSPIWKQILIDLKKKTVINLITNHARISAHWRRTVQRNVKYCVFKTMRRKLFPWLNSRYFMCEIKLQMKILWILPISAGNFICFKSRDAMPVNFLFNFFSFSTSPDASRNYRLVDAHDIIQFLLLLLHAVLLISHKGVKISGCVQKLPYCGNCGMMKT